MSASELSTIEEQMAAGEAVRHHKVRGLIADVRRLRAWLEYVKSITRCLNHPEMCPSPRCPNCCCSDALHTAKVAP